MAPITNTMQPQSPSGWYEDDRVTSQATSQNTATSETPAAGPTTTKQRLTTLVKAVLSVVLVVWIYRSVIAQSGDGIETALRSLRWEWLALALGVHLTQVAFNLGRWRILLKGQGIHAPFRFLVGSILIARFFGAVTPGGHLGYGGWRIYDVRRHTGKTARATATIAVEMIVGQLAFGAVVMAGSFFGARFIGTRGVLIVNAIFACIMIVGAAFLARPTAFAVIARRMPQKVQLRVQTLVDALAAYRGKSSIIGIALAFAIGTHTMHMLLYVCVAQALGAFQLGVGEVFFGSSLQVLATMVPTSINGIGLREMAAVALYTSPQIGVPMAIAVLIPSIGFAIEMLVSVLGAPIFLARRAGYAPAIVVDDPDREQLVFAQLPDVERTSLRRHFELGFGGGLLAGLVIGAVEGSLVLAGGRTDAWVLGYGLVAYSLFFGGVGATMGGALAFTMHEVKWRIPSDGAFYSAVMAALIGLAGFGIGLFRIRRDVFHEELAVKSLKFLGIATGALACALVVGLVLFKLVELLTTRTPARWLTRAWGTPALTALILLVVIPVTLMSGAPVRARDAHATAAPSGAGNVLVIVVDTLRADHLPAYGYTDGRTPHLDAFQRDAVRFDQAFSNASWTRPSFASIMTGRYATSHGVMAKSDALPDEVTTMAEAFGGAGYETVGFVTNYNVGPYFNFDQGFDAYHYLEPDFVLGADDSAAKLLLVQFLRQRIEGMRDVALGVRPGTTYQDAASVNRSIVSWLDQAPSDRPFMMFAGYMDPHDPYYEHPYNGVAYGRAAHPNPGLADAERLERLYDGEITFWDEHFGELVSELRRRGLYDDLTIVITADHGEEFGEHGGFWHGTTLYDEQVHVPLFVKLPANRRGGTVVSHWVQSIDVLPTLLRQQRLAVPDRVQGGDLFEGSTRVYAEESHEGNVLSAVRELRNGEALKLITANEGNPRRLPTAELFRVDTDRGETTNLADDATLRTPMEAARDEAAATAASHRAAGQAVELDDASRRQLCELGYLRGEQCNH